MKLKLKEAWNTVTDVVQQKSPEILTGLGVAGIFATAYMAYKASPKAHDILQRYHEDKQLVDPDDKEAKRAILAETAKDIVPVMLPPVLMGVASAACVIGGNRISSKRIAVLSAAYSLADSKLKDYQDKMLETLGEQKVQKVKEAIAKDHLENAPAPPSDSQLIVSDGNVMCMDSFSGRYFSGNAEKLGQIINELSYDIVSDMYISLNDLYEKIGLAPIPMGDEFGWNIDDTNKGRLPIYFTACLTDDKRPCLVLEYDVSCKNDYRNLH